MTQKRRLGIMIAAILLIIVLAAVQVFVLNGKKAQQLDQNETEITANSNEQEGNDNLAMENSDEVAERIQLEYRSIDYWMGRFAQTLALLDTRASKYGWTNTPDSAYLGWDGSYSMDALQRIYELTGNEFYIYKLSSYIHNSYQNLGDEDQDGYLGWGTTLYAKKYKEYFAHTASIVYQWARFILTVRNDPQLGSKPGPNGQTFNEQADMLEAIVHDQLLRKWDNRWSTPYRMYLYDHVENKYQSAPYNFYALMARALYKMFEVDPSRTHYLLWADDLMQLIRDHVAEKGEGFRWSYWDRLIRGDFMSIDSEDWSHAVTDYSAFLRAYARGHQGYSDEDLHKFTNTIYKNMWNGSYENPMLATNVNGHSPYDGQFTMDFGDMSLWNSEIWNLFEQYLALHLPKSGGGARNLLDIAVILQHHPQHLVPAAFHLSSPADRATLQGTAVSFQWQPAANASKYTLQVATDKAFQELVINRGNLLGTGTIVDGLAYGKTYFWRVFAENASGMTKPSEVYSFKTKSAPKYMLTFAHYDDLAIKEANVIVKQVWLNDQLVWEKDAAKDAAKVWKKESVDITAFVGTEKRLRLKLTVASKAALPGQASGHSFHVVWDNVSVSNADVINGGFERDETLWHFTEKGGQFSGEYQSRIKNTGEYAYQISSSEEVPLEAGSDGSIEIEWAVQ